MINNGNFFPGILAYPSLPIYLCTTIQYLTFKYDSFTKSKHFDETLKAEMYPFYSNANLILNVRYFVSIISAIIILLLTLLTYKLSNSYLATIWCFLFCSVSQLFEYHSKNYVNVDIFVTFFVCLNIFYFIFSKNLSSTFYDIVIPGILTGFVIASKYPHGIIIVIYLIKLFNFQKGEILVSMYKSILLFLISLITFFLCCPYTLIFSKMWINSLIAQREIYNNGWIGYTVIPGLSNLILQFKQLIYEFGILPLIFFFIGTFYLIIKHKRFGIGIITYFFLFLLYYCSFPINLVRNLLPLYILVPFISALGFYFILTFFKSYSKHLYFLTAIFPLLAFTSPYSSYKRNFLPNSLESRNLAIVKITSEIPTGSKIFISSEIGLNLNKLNGYEIQEVNFLNTKEHNKTLDNLIINDDHYYVIPKFASDLRWPNDYQIAQDLNNKYKIKNLIFFVKGRIGGSDNYLNLSSAGVLTNYLPPVPWGNPSIYIGKGLVVTNPLPN